MIARILFLVCVLSSLCLSAQRARIVKLPYLDSAIHDKKSKIKVINFWATWCGPCVKELPLFDKIDTQKGDVSVLLVSIDLDLNSDPNKVWAFIDKRKITSRVVILNEQNPDNWIASVDNGWSGALPATLIVNSVSGQRRFIEHELHEGELEKLINELK